MARYNFNGADSIQDRVNAYLSQSANRAFNDRAAAINRTLESKYSNWTGNPRGTSLDRRTVQPSRVNRRRPTRKYKNVVKPTNTDGEEYTIKAGDTLSGILKAKGINADWRAVAKANGIADGNRIIAGQKIKLPSVSKSNSNKSNQPEANKPALPANQTAANNGGASAGQPAGNNTQRRESAPQRAGSAAQRNNTVPTDTVRNNSVAVANVGRDSVNVARPDTTRVDSTRVNTARADTIRTGASQATPASKRRTVSTSSNGANRTSSEGNNGKRGSFWDYISSYNITPGTATAYNAWGNRTQRVPMTNAQIIGAAGTELDALLTLASGAGIVSGARHVSRIGKIARKFNTVTGRVEKMAQGVSRTRKAQAATRLGELYKKADARTEVVNRARRIANIRNRRTSTIGSTISDRLNQVRGKLSDIWGGVKQRVRNWFPESGAENVRVSEEVGQRTARDTRPFRRRVADWRERLRTDRKAGYDVAPKPRTTPRSKGDHYGEVRRQFGKDRAVGSTRDGRTFEIERGEASRAWKPKNAIDRINRNAADRSSAPKPAAKPAPKPEPMVEAKPEPKPAPKPAPKSETKAAPKKPSTAGRKSSSERRAERKAKAEETPKVERAARGSRKRK